MKSNAIQFGHPVAMLLGHFAVRNDSLTFEDNETQKKEGIDIINSQSNDKNFVEQYVEAVDTVLRVQQRCDPEKLKLWRSILCAVLYELTKGDQTCSEQGTKNHKFDFTKHESQNEMTYLCEFLPSLRVEEFLKICFKLQFFAELGKIVCHSEYEILVIVEQIWSNYDENSEDTIRNLAKFSINLWKSKADNLEDYRISLDFVKNYLHATDVVEKFEEELLKLLAGDLKLMQAEIDQYKKEFKPYSYTRNPESFNKETGQKLKKLVKLTKTIVNELKNNFGVQVESVDLIKMEIDKCCFLIGFDQCEMFNSRENVIDHFKNVDGCREIDIAVNSVKYFLNDNLTQFCYVMDYFSKLESSQNDKNEFETILGIVETYLPLICCPEVMNKLLYLTLAPGPCEKLNCVGTKMSSDSICLLRNVFFENMIKLTIDDIEILRINLYEELKNLGTFNEWSICIAEEMGLTLSKLTELFNRISPKDLHEQNETMNYLSKCSFVIPDKIIEKAVHDAFATRGKTMLIQLLFQKLPSLLKLTRKESENKIPYVIEVIATTNVSNANSACQFVRFLVDTMEVSSDMMFVRGIIPKFSGNKVNAVKLLTSILPLLKNEKVVYASILNKFFNKQMQNHNLDLNDKWVLNFTKVGFAELIDIVTIEDTIIDYRKLMIQNDSDKFLALVEYFRISCLVLPKVEYNMARLELKNIPEFLKYSAQEVSLSALRFMTSDVKSLDIRAFAVSLKLLIAQSLFDRRQIDNVNKSVNMVVWKTILRVIKLCLSCEDVSYHANLLESLTAIVKGVLKWLKMETDLNEGDIFGPFDLFFFCVHMLDDILLCCLLTLNQQQEIVFRDCFYLLIDQMQLLGKMLYENLQRGNYKDYLHKDEEGTSTVVTWVELKTMYNDSVCKTAKCCSYSLPQNLNSFLNSN